MATIIIIWLALQIPLGVIVGGFIRGAAEDWHEANRSGQ